jgi:sugar/nucleoside kinase (ribokinase family)
MSLLVVGSVAYDSVRTPAGSRKDALGGSATYFSVSGSYFAEVSVVAVVGEDFRQDDMELLTSHEVDVSGLERRPGSTFRWSGVYGAEDLKNRETLETLLNVFADFAPRLSAEQRRRPYLFLANIAPELQLSVLSQMEARPRLVALDTMDYWIEGSVDSLREVVKKVDILFMDEGEVRSFAGDSNLVKAARRIMDIGPATVVVKRGEHGVLLFQGGEIFAAPAVPLAQVVDPTGAGDSFAGGFMGYLAATGDLSAESYRRAAVVGSVMGSFAVESFSLERLAGLTRQEIDGRFRELTSLAHFLPLDERESLTERVKAQA